MLSADESIPRGFLVSAEDLETFHVKHFGVAPDLASIPGQAEANEHINEPVAKISSGSGRARITKEQIAFLRDGEIRRKTLEAERLKVQTESIDNVEAVSVEETIPSMPVTSDFSEYARLFGPLATDISAVDKAVDEHFARICATHHIKHYYPVLPL